MPLTGRIWLVLVALAMAACGPGVDDESDRPSETDAELVSMHWPVTQPDQEARVCIDYVSGEEILVEPEPVLGMRDFREARTEPGSLQPTLYLTEAGAERLATLTEENVGRALALVVDGRVMAQPIIRVPITDGRMDFMPISDQGEREAMVGRINAALSELRRKAPGGS